MNARRLWGPFFPVLLLVLSLLAPAAKGEDAPGARVDEVSLGRNATGQLTVGFSVLNAASDAKLQETVESGLPVRFIYRLRLMRTSAGPFGGIVADRSFERLLEKDNLKNRYRVTQGEESEDLPTFEGALARLSRVEEYGLAALRELRSRESYKVELQVKLEEFRLPFHLHRLLPFMNFWDVTTPWLAVPVPAELLKRP